MTSTTQVRMAVAALESTFSMPIFARTEVAAAKTAESRAKTNHTLFSLCSPRLMSVIRKVPAAIMARKMSLSHQSVRSFSNRQIAKSTDKTVPDLSTAATLETSPTERALK